MTQMFFGTAGALPLSSADDRTAPWWAIFRDLRDARAALGLKARHLNTLAALLSFLKPGGPLVVFASNRSILERLNGLCERSLQRHLHDLAAAGLVERRDSPNGKRFRLFGGDSVLTYGLDLSPLMAQAARLAELAETTRVAMREARLWRQRVLDRLAELTGTIAPEAEHRIRLLLRRPQPSALWQTVLTELQDLSDPAVSTELSASDRHSVGHHQKSEKEGSSEGTLPVERVTSDPQGLLRQLRAACPGVAQWIDGGLQSWEGIRAQIRRLAGWIGIGEPLYHAAAAKWGEEGAAATLCGIAQMGDRVRQPAAYFRSLTTGRQSLRFDPSLLLARLARGGDVIRG